MKTMQLSLDYLRKRNWSVAIVEKNIPKTFIKKDCFGFGDILGVNPAYAGATLFQVTSYSNISTRYKKIIEIPESKLWLQCGNHIVIHGWKKNKKIKRTDPACILIEKEVFEKDCLHFK